MKFDADNSKIAFLPPIFVGGIFKAAYSTCGCTPVNGYVILILKIKLYNKKAESTSELKMR